MSCRFLGQYVPENHGQVSERQQGTICGATSACLPTFILDNGAAYLECCNPFDGSARDVDA